MAIRLPLALLALACCAALCACGSGATTTVTAKGEPPPSGGSSTSTQSTSTGSGTSAPAHAQEAPTSSSGAGGSSAPSTTRTAPEPAFTEGSSSAGATSAIALVRSHGYTPVEPAEYHEHQTLAVLVGRRAGSAEGYDEQAFFFVDGRYIGTDAKEPSASVEVVSQQETEVTLAYPLYRSGDPLGSPSGGRALVHFQLNDGKLQPLGQIPPARSPTAPSRR